MIDHDNLRKTVVSGLKKYLGVEVIQSNQNKKPPKYKYLSYTVTTPMSANNGTFGEWSDGIHRQAVKQTWSITSVSDDEFESIELANKARTWLQHFGRQYLNDNDVIVESVTGITNRDNFLTIDYEYRNGFDVVFWLYDEVENPTEGTITEVEIGGKTVIKYNENTEDL